MINNFEKRLFASKLTALFAGLVAGAITAPILGRAARPLARRLVKAGLVAQREIRELAAGAREELEDITAEVKHEIGESPAPAERPRDGGHHHQDQARA